MKLYQIYLINNNKSYCYSSDLLAKFVFVNTVKIMLQKFFEKICELYKVFIDKVLALVKTRLHRKNLVKNHFFGKFGMEIAQI